MGLEFAKNSGSSRGKLVRVGAHRGDEHGVLCSDQLDPEMEPEAAAALAGGKATVGVLSTEAPPYVSGGWHDAARSWGPRKSIKARARLMATHSLDWHVVLARGGEEEQAAALIRGHRLGLQRRPAHALGPNGGLRQQVVNKVLLLGRERALGLHVCKGCNWLGEGKGVTQVTDSAMDSDAGVFRVKNTMQAHEHTTSQPPAPC